MSCMYLLVFECIYCKNVYAIHKSMLCVFCSFDLYINPFNWLAINTNVSHVLNRGKARPCPFSSSKIVIQH